MDVARPRAAERGGQRRAHGRGGALVVLSGLLPAGLAVATGALAGAVPAAVGSGLASGAGRPVLTALLVTAGVYVLIQFVGPLRAMVTDVLMRRVDESVAAGLAAAVSAPPGIAHLEDPAVLDLVAQAQGTVTGRTVGPALSYLTAAWALRLQGWPPSSSSPASAGGWSRSSPAARRRPMRGAGATGCG